MPYEWTPPEIALEFQGVTIWHVYRRCMVSDFWYTTVERHDDLDERPFDGQFDIRDLRFPFGFEWQKYGLSHQAAMRLAIIMGLLTQDGPTEDVDR